MKKHYVYLDDVRTPLGVFYDTRYDHVGKIEEWVVVRSYDEFVAKVQELGLANIALISLDHDLGPSAMKEWKENVYKNYELDYDNIEEKTGYDCAKWLVERWMDGEPIVKVVTHSANAIGSANIMGYINNYMHINQLPQECVRVNFPFSIEQGNK